MTMIGSTYINIAKLRKLKVGEREKYTDKPPQLAKEKAKIRED